MSVRLLAQLSAGIYMCFSMGMSFGVAAAAVAGAGILAKKGAPPKAFVPILFFAGMETLQGSQYFFIDDCSAKQNQWLTYLAFIHVAFQPFMFNWWLTYFMEKKDKIYTHYWWKIIGPLCLVAAAFTISKLYIGSGLPLCTEGVEVFCGPHVCSYSGNWHVAWQLPLRAAGAYYITPSIFIHFFLYFIPGAIAGFWLILIFVGITGPLLALLITPNINEQPAIWCFYSTVQMSFTYFYLLKKSKPISKVDDT